MPKKTFSIIGCQHGHIGVFIEEMLDLGHECAGIYEQENKELLESVADHFSIPIAEDRETLLDSSVDIVGSSAINNEKIDIIELCEKHGKHIMVDKPVITSRSGLERLNAVIKRKKIQVGMLLTERYRPVFRTLKRYIDQGTLGDIVNIGMRKPHKLTPASRPQWHFSKEQNGGIVIDLFVHDFDLIRWLTGQEVAESSGVVSKNILPEYPTFYDTATLQVRLDRNTLVQFYADWHTPEAYHTYGDGRVFVVGTQGYAELRLSGDPLITDDSFMYLVTHDEDIKKVKLDPVQDTITGDFLNRVEGNQADITHNDILEASKATVEGDIRWI